ncbi:MAG: hypothetical protein OEQ12_04870 [Nitrosopumilus sp.]|nr:hypothetical protein [Nitrosopumilus sp.]
MGDRRLVIPVIIGVMVLAVAGFNDLTSAEKENDFFCNPNVDNGHVRCSAIPSIGDRGLFILDSQNKCPIDVSFIIENKMVVTFGNHPDCKFNDGFKLALIIDA